MRDDDVLTELVVAELRSIALTSRGIAGYAMQQQHLLDQELAAGYYSKDTFMRSLQNILEDIEDEHGAIVWKDRVTKIYPLHAPTLEMLSEIVSLIQQFRPNDLWFSHGSDVNHGDVASTVDVTISMTAKAAEWLIQALNDPKLN